MNGKLAVRNLVGAALLCLGLAMPVLAQGVGAIGGNVIDESGAVLPGATVTLTAAGIIGGNQETVSDARGAYQFVRLVPGRYSVKAELTGFRAAVLENINVNADNTSRADLKLAVGEISEQMTITAEAPLLDTTSARNQTVMTRDVLDALPSGNDIWSIARLAPAVQTSKYDVGGREMFGQSSNTVHGSQGGERQYLVDGMDINSYNGGLSFYVDSFGFQEINFQTGQAPAESTTGGVVMNMVTKTGTNQLRGSYMFSGTTHALESDNISDALRPQLLAGVPAAALAANPDIKLGAAIEHIFDTAFNISGPLVKDKLWAVMTAKLGEVYSRRVGSYNSDGTQLLNDNQMRNIMPKLSWAVNQSNQLHFMYSFVRKGRYHVAGGPTVTEFFDTKATAYNPSKNNMLIARWTDVLSSRAVMDVAASTTFGQNNQVWQKEVKITDIPTFDSVTRINNVAAGTYNVQDGQRSNASASLAYVAGQHDIKTGYQFLFNTNGSGGISTVNYRAVYRNGVPDSVNTYNTPIAYDRNTREMGLYVQDKWRPARKLTLNVGVRFSSMYGWLNDGTSPLCQPQNQFIAGQCFPAVKGIPDFKSVLPRFSLIYDMFGDGRTALKFSANRYVVPSMATTTGGGITDRVNPIRQTSDTRPWTVCTAGQTSGCDLNGDKIATPNEFGVSTGFNLGTTNRYGSNFKWPTSDEVGVEIEQQLGGAVVVSAGYYYRGHKSEIGQRNLKVPTSSYTPITVTEVTSGKTVTVFNQDAATRGLFDTVWETTDTQDSTFHGADLIIQKRMSNRWMVLGSLSLGKTDGNIYTPPLDQNNPNNIAAFTRGPDTNDVPVSFKLSGAYDLPYGVSLGASGQYFRGWPDTNTVQVTSATVRLTQTNQNLVVEPRGTSRLDDVKMVDLNIRKVISKGHYKLEPRMDIFNLFNSAAVTQWITQYGPSYHRAIELLGARLIKFGVNFDF